MKKWLLGMALLIAAVCVICVALRPAEVHAASIDDLSYTIINGEVTITDCSETASGDLVIPATIEGYPVVAIGNQAFWECTELESIVIPEGVKSIGSYAFGTNGNWYGLRTITIPSTMTSFGDHAFYGSYIEEIHIADLISWMNIKKNSSSQWDTPFADYGSLYINGEKIEDLVIPDGVEEIPDYAFSYCRSIVSITLPESVKVIGHAAFFSCDSLNEMELSGVYEIGDFAFTNCPLESATITMPNQQVNYDFSTFTYTGVAFKTSEDNLFYSVDEQGAVYNKDKTELLYMPSSVKNCIIPASVTKINADVLSSINHILFEGTQEQWGKIDVGVCNYFDAVFYNYVEGVEYHKWALYRTITEATCKDFGKVQYRCSDCGQKKTEDTDKLIVHTWSEAIPLSETTNAYLCITCGKVRVEGIVNVENKEEHFHEDAIIEVLVIDESSYEEAHQIVSEALKDHHDYVAYDINAILEERYVQPNGTISITVAIPEEFNLDSITIAYISTDGELVNIPCEIDREKRIATFTTDHFSYYAMTTGALLGDADGDLVITANDAYVLKQHRAGLAELSEETLTLCDVSGNGTADVYDAYLIQLYAAGIIDKFPCEN